MSDRPTKKKNKPRILRPNKINTRPNDFPNFKTLSAVIIIAGLTIAVFLKLRTCEFVAFDDDVYVTNNLWVQAGITFKNIKWAFSTLYAGFWHPLTLLSLMLDYEIYGLDSAGFHLTNVFFHAASAVILFLALKKMTFSYWKSLFVALVFAVHPLGVESVAWIAERKNVLCIFFWMLTMFAYASYAPKPTVVKYLLVLVCFVMGLMAKSMILTLPVLLLLLDYWPLNRLSKNSILEKLPLLVLSAVFVWITLLAEHRWGVVKSFETYPLKIRLVNAVVCYVRYIGKTFWPANLAVFYPHPESSLSVLEIFATSVLLFGTTAYAISVRKRYGWFTVGWLWFVITLLPVSGIIQLGLHSMADRYAYGPTIGLFIISAWQVPRLFERWKFSTYALGFVSVLVLAALTMVTSTQLDYWKNSMTLFEHATKVTTNNYWAHNNIGVLLVRQGKVSQGMGHYQKALEIDPNNCRIYNNIGTALALQGKIDEAVKNYKEAIKLAPQDWEAYTNLGILFSQLGELDKAVDYLQQSVKLNPFNVEAINSLGIVFAGQKRFDEAGQQFMRVIFLNPNHINAYNNLGNAFLGQQKYDEAIKYFKKAIQLKPDLPDVYYNLAQVYIRKGDLDEAIAEFKKFLTLKPADDNTAYNIGVLLVQQGKTADAEVYFKKAMEINPAQHDAAVELEKIQKQKKQRL